jgi:hypothetical protein
MCLQLHKNPSSECIVFIIRVELLLMISSTTFVKLLPPLQVLSKTFPLLHCDLLHFLNDRPNLYCNVNSIQSMR